MLRASISLGFLALAAALAACDYDADLGAGPGPGGGPAVPDGGGVEGDGGAPDGAAPDGGPPTFGGLAVDTTPDQQALDLFGAPGHRFWVEAQDEQVDRMNERDNGGGIPGPIFQNADPALSPLAPAYGGGALLQKDVPGVGGDIYTPGGVDDAPTYADHVVVQDVVTGSVADYGKVEVRLVGESTFRTWDGRNIPNVRIDSDEFVQGLRIGGYEHIRLNNSIVGNIFRENVAHRIFRALGYPGLRSSYAFLGGSVWGEGTWVPMTLMEVYKLRFCKDNATLVGGECVNMWEFAGDLAGGDRPPNACQVSSCDDTRIEELAELLASTPPGPGFRDALAAYIDWPRFQQFQCIGWILATGDDGIRAQNNHLVMERADGKFVFAPYSIDISMGQEWYPSTPLLGQSALPRGCQTDPECWADAVVECEALVEKFDALDPETLVDETRRLLEGLGMMRSGDADRAVELREWLVKRQSTLRDELARFRRLPDELGSCGDELVACADGGCGTALECETRRCSPELTWCETTSQCIGLLEECPACEGRVPLFCSANFQCVPDAPACSLECQIAFGAFSEYCPATRECTQEWNPFCPDEGDGGVRPPAGDGGIPPDGGVVAPLPEPRPF